MNRLTAASGTCATRGGRIAAWAALLLAWVAAAAPATAQSPAPRPLDARPSSAALTSPTAPTASAALAGSVGNDIVDIYEQALAHLEKICDDYRRIRAIQLAQTRDIPFEEAYDNISSVMPVLDPIDKALLRQAIRDPADIAPHKREVERVEKDIETMIDLAAKLLEEIEQAKEVILEGGAEIPKIDPTLEEIVQKPEYDPEAVVTITSVRAAGGGAMQQLEQEAKQDDQAKAKDLTAFMRPLMPDIKDLTKSDTGEEAKPLNLFTSKTDGLAVLMRIKDDDANKTMARRVAAGGVPAEWMFVASWYTIGPFPNPQRINLNTKFPPETVVDLDAAYPGKGGRLVKWVWTQSAESMVIPAHPEEYAIYYAYTEVYCERPMDLWVAVGSDDKANVWLNGMPIWVSGDQLKGWRLDEGFRKVSFRQGVNKVLYRVENGWLNVAFSMGIRTAP